MSDREVRSARGRANREPCALFAALPDPQAGRPFVVEAGESDFRALADSDVILREDRQNRRGDRDEAAEGQRIGGELGINDPVLPHKSRPIVDLEDFPTFDRQKMIAEDHRVLCMIHVARAASKRITVIMVAVPAIAVS